MPLSSAAPLQPSRDVLDHLLEGCQIIGRDFTYLYVNDAVARHGRTTKEALLGRRMSEVYPGIEETPMFGLLRRCMEARTAERLENEFTFPDGSVGWFELRAAALTRQLLAFSRRAAAPPPVQARGAETVLVVEDEEAVRRLAIRILMAAGYTVISAANGGEALLACERHRGPIDLLLTDVVMPTMSGRELADRLAALRPGLRVLFMSGYTANSIVHHGVLDAATRFIEKPFASSDLVNKVAAVLARAG